MATTQDASGGGNCDLAMTLTAALWLLLSCSDLMGPGWNYVDAGWHLGLRQDGATWTDSADGSTMQATGNFTDWLNSFPRPITREERPFVQLWVHIPTLPHVPNANGNDIYFGHRVTIVRDSGSFVWSGIFVGRDENDAPTLFYRVQAGFSYGRPIEEDAWWTLGIGWGDVEADPLVADQTADGYWHGVVSFYAAPGKVQLTEADKFATDTSLFPLLMKTVNGHFLDIALAVGEAEQPAWTLAQITTHAAIVPTLDISRDGQSVTLTASGFPGETYSIERSEDLSAWLPLSSSNDPITQPQQFYRAVSQ